MKRCRIVTYIVQKGHPNGGDRKQGKKVNVMRNILVVGGSKGIGKEITRGLLAEGNRVTVLCRHIPKDKEEQAVYYCADLEEKSSLENIIRELFTQKSEVDTLVFCQRYRGNDEAWQGEWHVSLTATKRIIEAFAQRDAKKDGAIVILGSIAVDHIADEQPISYHVGKGALTQLMRYYAVQLGADNIRVNMVSPGVVVKERNRDYFESNKKLIQLYEDIIPLKRMGQSHEIADVVSYLCGPKSSFLTGQNIVVDGGLTLRWQESLARNLIDILEIT